MPRRKRSPGERKLPLQFGEVAWKYTLHQADIESAFKTAMDREYGRYAKVFNEADMPRNVIEEKARRRIKAILRGYEEGADMQVYAFVAFRTAIFKEALRAIDYLKRQRDMRTGLPISKVENPREAAQRKELMETIRKKVDALPEKTRVVFST